MDAVVTAVLGILALYLFGGLKVLREYERAVYFFLGRSWGAKGPGLIYVPPEMKRAMARQAEAERERRAKIINAEGELQASEKLAQAAHIIGAEPAAIQLRFLQTVTEIASENNSTTIFPLPLDLFRGFFENGPKRAAAPALPEKASGDPLPAPPRKTESGA